MSEPRAVDFDDPEINRLWDEAVQQQLGFTASILIRSVMPRMQERLAEAIAIGARQERERLAPLFDAVRAFMDSPNPRRSPGRGDARRHLSEMLVSLLAEPDPMDLIEHTMTTEPR